MRREWEPEELIACWTLLDSDRALLANKAAATRLGFALMLKFFELEARFPSSAAELPRAAVRYVAEQVNVDADQMPSTTGRDARSSTTARRSATRSASAR